MCSTQVLYKSSLTLRHRSAHEKSAVTTTASDAPANSSRVVFPNTHDRPDLHSPIVFLRRHAILFVLYFIWIILIGTYVTLWMISAACIARSIVSLGAVPVPLAVQLYLAGMVAYFVFRRVRFGNKTQGDWPAVRAWCRRNAIDYSYFRHHICVFEDREEESLQEPEKPMVPANDKALFAYHPHGVLSSGWALNGSHSMRFKESDARWLVADNIFWFPFAGDVLHWLAYDGANKKNFVHHLKNDRNVCLLPGGFEEATIYQRGKHRVYIKKRAGFIKLALQFGYKVHPVYTFGEEQLFNTFTGFLKQRLMMNAWKMPGVVFFGRLLCFFMPFEDVELTTVVGSPIQLPKIENPTDEEVAKYHGMYIDALAALYERHKHKYAVDPSLPLEIF